LATYASLFVLFFIFLYFNVHSEEEKGNLFTLSRSSQNRNCLKFGIFGVFLFFFLIMVRWKIGETCWGRGTFWFIKISMKISTLILYYYVNINSAAALEWQYLCFYYALCCVSSLCCLICRELFELFCLNELLIHPPNQKRKDIPFQWVLCNYRRKLATNETKDRMLNSLRMTLQVILYSHALLNSYGLFWSPCVALLLAFWSWNSSVEER